MTSALEARLADLDAAAREFLAPLEQDPARWARASAGRWSAGQHAEHVALCLEKPAGLMEENRARLRAGTLPSPPGRGPLEFLFVAIVVEGGWMPRGGAARPFALPGAAPDRDAVLARIRQAPARFRALAAGLTPAERDRLWIENPFTPLRWHYRLPELVRIQAVHLRHHGRQVAEIG